MSLSIVPIPTPPSSLEAPPLPTSATTALVWRGLHGSAQGLALARAMETSHAPLVVVTTDVRRAQILESEITFYRSAPAGGEVLLFPDSECLPYDAFSPHQDLISARLRALAAAPALERGIIIAPLQNLMQRFAPREFVLGHSFSLAIGQRLNIEALRLRLQQAAYQTVSQVMAPGEFAVRGGLIDLFPMGQTQPFRIDLFGDEIDTIRYFEPESQRSTDTAERIELLPGREFPLDAAAIKQFRGAFRSRIEGDPQHQIIYREVSRGHAPAGVEFYLPLFFEQTETLFDYAPSNTIWVLDSGIAEAAGQFHAEVADRYHNARLDADRRPLPPDALYLEPAALEQQLTGRRRIHLDTETPTGGFATSVLPELSAEPRDERPYQRLCDFLNTTPERVLIVAESPGRREALDNVLRQRGFKPAAVDSWPQFAADATIKLALTLGAIERGVTLADPGIAIITEAQLYGDKVLQRRRRERAARDPDAVIRSLAELKSGDPVVHEDHGVGRYRGLQVLGIEGEQTEFLCLEYRDADKLYVPVLSLHLISRYVAGHPDQAPLHKLGTDAWQKAQRRARAKAYDVATELLEVDALRNARQGVAMTAPDDAYEAFVDKFPFEETPDQTRAIGEVIADLAGMRPMDRLVSGDVGFGKTEIALRAAFIAVHNARQVAMLVPTTLLAQQHFETFRDRFAELPVEIELLSRFRTRKQIDTLVAGLERGYPDIVIGTHRLLQRDITFKDLGLVIIDEEHRFGVRQKERLKRLRSEVDIISLSATPIPRTLNMAMAGMREVSIIATPPRERLSIKTFVRPWNKALIREACLREIRRGGQMYFLHNEVRTIESTARELAELVPEAVVHFAHGQMHELELERIMQDFYHQRLNVLVCSTIIESGIDIPSANTIIINRADRLGLAQLHQLRGRVGRSHHQAYAYLLTPPDGATITADARKRLDAIASLEDLGAGFALASHDLEIRGAGELLGETQSGSMDEVGFTLYAEYLKQAIAALRGDRGSAPTINEPTASHAIEINLHTPALFPETFLPDVYARLVLYKRLASAASEEALYELMVETIDRFGLLPEPAKMLFRLTGARLAAAPLGIRRIDLGADGGHIDFGETRLEPSVIVSLLRTDPTCYRLTDGTRLRISAALADPGERVSFIEELLKRLSGSLERDFE